MKLRNWSLPGAWASGACGYSSSSVLVIASRLVESRGWMVARTYANSPSIVTMKSRFLKRTYAPQTQLTP